MTDETRLKVGELTGREDFGRGIARIDMNTMKKIGVKEGDIVELEGKKKTAAVAIRSYPADIGLNLIRVDGLVRKNCEASIGEWVALKKAESKEAKKVILAPAQRGYTLHISPNLLKQNLFMRPMVKGDIIITNPVFKTRGRNEEDLFSQFFGINIEEVFIGLGPETRLIVVKTLPEGVTQINEMTEVELLPEAVDMAEMKLPTVTYEDIGGLNEIIPKIREMIEIPLRRPEVFERLGVESPKGVLLFGTPGCLTSDALVALEDGRLVRIGELGQNLIPGVYIADLPVYPPAHAKAIHIYDVPETVEIITESGRRLRMTPNHPLMTDSGWTEAEKLKVGNTIKIFNWIPSPTNFIPTNFKSTRKRKGNECKIPSIFDEKLALLAGIFIAEGSREYGRITFVINDNEKELREKIINLVKNLFDIKHTESKDKFKQSLRIRFSNLDLSNFFKPFWSEEKRIPSEILLSPNNVAANFLTGLFEGDGHVVKKNRWFDRAITLKSKSRKLLEEVQILLLRWNIESHIYGYEKNSKNVHCLKISGYHNLKKFKENINFLSKNKINVLENQIKSYKRISKQKEKTYEIIKDIKKINGWQRVYDFEVPTTHSFFSNGILSHNTGKTLIAKAVANESGAHFISLAGPEIFCVSTSTPIILNNAGLIEAGKLLDVEGRKETNGNYEIITPKETIKVFGVDNNFKIAKSKIEKIIKVPVDEVFVIDVEREEPIEVSSNQPFLNIDNNGNISWKRAKEINIGDHIGFVTQLPVGETQKIEWWEILNKDNFYIFEGNKIFLIKDYKGNFQNVKIGYSENKSNINKIKPIKLPSRTSKELLEFLGFFFSEGSINDEEVSISNKDKKIKERVRRLFEYLFDIEAIRIKDDGDKIKVYSHILAEFLHRIFNLPNGRKGEKLTLPPIIFNCSKDEIATFLRSYFEGDGSLKIDKNGYPSIEYYSISKDVLLGIKILLTFFNIRSRIKKRKLIYALTVLDGEGRKRFLDDIFPEKHVQYFDSKHVLKNSEWLPISNLIKTIKELEGIRYGKDIKENSIEPYISGRKRLTKKKTFEIISMLEKFVKNDNSRKLCERVKELINLPISWTKVTNVRNIKKKAVLVDLEVSGISNFVGSDKLLLLHNSKWYGQTEENLRRVFEEAEKNAPSIIFVDEIDAIAPKREEVTGEVERRTVSQLLTLMDGLKSRGKIIVIAATNRPNSLDPALRRTGRFDRELEIPIPDKKGRKEILQIHTRNMPMEKDIDLDKLAETTYGYVGADIAGLAKEAAMHALRRVLPEISGLKENDPIPKELLEKLKVTKEDFDYALRVVQPSAMREILIEIPKVKWQDVGGLEEIKESLKEAVQWPLKSPEGFKRLGIRPPRGILLYGPPGCGKTYIVKALANEAGVNFIAVKGPEVLTMWVGESERKIREIFRRAKQVAPAIILFDEIDALAPRRGLETGSRVAEQVVSTLLTEMSGIEEMEGVVVVATSVTGDTPILIKDSKGIRLLPIANFVDPYYTDEGVDIEKPVYNIQCLGFNERISHSRFASGLRFGSSAFKNVRGVFRHKVNEIYEIEFLGGKLRTTDNHSVFIRTKNGIKAKRVDELKPGEILVDLPFKVRTYGNSQEIRANNFNKDFNLKLPVFDQDPVLEETYNFSLDSNLSQSQIALQTGFSQPTISNWQRGINLPRELSKKYFKHELPEFVGVTPDLMRLFGYYTAEGYARKELDFCFNENEENLINDTKALMEKFFNMAPDRVRKITKNAINLVYHSKPLAQFFARIFGKGAYKKHAPSFLFEAPYEYFLEFIRGYVAGDGHIDKRGNLGVTSVSKQLILELNWLFRMHGIKSFICKFIAKSGRRINGKVINQDTLAYRLCTGKTNNPLINPLSKILTNNSSKRAKIKTIRKIPFDGYVYDLCGCDNEAFFGGESPILLHNTNRPDIIDSALLRPGRFDRIIYVPAPDEKTRLEILKIHTKNMPLKGVSAERIAKDTDGYSGADLEALVREAALFALREDVNKAKEVTAKHFDKALKRIKPSITADTTAKYHKAVEDLRKTQLEEVKYIG